MSAAEKVDPPNEPPTTEQVLQAMMTENTGTHLLDSGGAYGRKWEQNQGVDFEKLPSATLKGEVWKSGSYLNVTLNVYHWLKERLSYNHELSQSLHAYGTRPENEREAWMGSVEGWAEERQETVDMGGIYGENDPFWVNTYNHESLLSQIVQFYYWTEGDRRDRKTYVALQIHGGCDARGGYTDPVVFEVDDGEGLSILDDTRGTIGCDNCNRVWDTDDANHWRDEGESGSGGDALDPDELNEFPMANAKTDEGDKGPRPGVVFVGENDECHCPGCGTGNLSAYLYPCG